MPHGRDPELEESEELTAPEPANRAEARAGDRDDRTPRKSARDKVMDFLARRGHSELELRQKLSRTYAEDEVDDAIAFAAENNWLTPPAELAERVAAELGRKKKGHRYINQFLKNKGLPTVAKDLDEEVRKGIELLRSKLRIDEGPLKLTYEERGKAYRTLANRGFDDETIRRVLSETQ